MKHPRRCDDHRCIWFDQERRLGARPWGASTEITIVGNEGLVGILLFMGGGSTCSCAVVQSLRLRADLMKAECERAGPVMHVALRYTQALIPQVS